MAANPFKRVMPPLGTEGKVSGADRKKLRRALEKAFALNESDLEAVLPAKEGELISVKLAAPRREVIYKLDGLPIILDTSNKGDLLPTVFALWKAPSMLPRVYLKHPAVSTYIVGGADLMLPGVHMPPEGLPEFKKGDLIAICVHGNPCPIAVGTAGMSNTDALTRKSGKLVEVLQAYGDMLWQVVGGRVVPNDGFLADAVVPVGQGAAGLDASDYQEDEQGQPIINAPDQAPAGGLEASTQEQNDHSTTPDTSVKEAQQQLQGLQIAGEPSNGTAAAVPAADNGQQGPGERVFPDNMDELLELTLLQALHRSVKDNALPLTSSVLWAQHMQPSRPAGSSLDVKKSSHKKLSTFLKAYGGRNGLLVLKEDKHSGDQVITSVNRNHSLYQEFRPYRLSLTAGGSDGSSQEATSSSVQAPSTSGQGSSTDAALVVEEMWKPGKELRPIFEELGLPFDALYTPPELSDIAFSYVTHAELTKSAPDERTIVLDTTLCDALFKGIIKKGEPWPSHLPKSELREAFMRRCVAQCRISRGLESIVKKGSAPNITVNVERRQGNKYVTRIVGVEAFLISPDVLARDCQKRFASSCTANELPGKNQGHEVVVQGNVLEHMAAFLHDKYSIPKKLIVLKEK